MKSLKRVEGINVVPLIDIMLVLLTIVLTVSSFIALGKIEISLPQASNFSKVEPKFYEIGITADHQFFINGEAVVREDLHVKFETLSKEDSVAISADKMAAYEDFIYIIDLLKAKEIEKIGMVVNKNE
ncbi:biopolymer transporter ExbD [Sulfurospirillum barnesii]|uniref:Biopolymer transport protein n=1 Tax=Sulfurospirillum barnesii (strain ATCC 700032 / DSM 10660 / SES-3) TaxID=760154 RepID=I3XY94_SULBS|nr:biopolymer transporter ExbD [Sulfurospirillum barnesii]AFL68918.1 biopolymer transport protein [Sulfurospirillum barnesii SES-3]